MHSAHLSSLVSCKMIDSLSSHVSLHFFSFCGEKAYRFVRMFGFSTATNGTSSVPKQIWMHDCSFISRRPSILDG